MNEPLSLVSRPSAFFLTNRFNLLHVLSAGFIPTREGFPKYYDDLLVRAPGRVVLFSGPLSTAMADEVQPMPVAFPVALEVPGLTDRDRRTPAFPSSEGAGERAWAPEGPWPLLDRTVVHFRDEGERREFEARSFPNVRSPNELRVTPSLFRDGSLRVDELSTWLASLPAVRTEKASFFDLDKRLGAVALAVEMRARLTGEAAALSLLDVLVRTHDGPSALEAIVRRPLPQAELEAIVFGSACRLLAEVDPIAGYAPLVMIKTLRDDLQGQLDGRDAEDTVRARLDHAESVLRAEADMRPFAKAQGLVSVKALVLAALRRDADRVFRMAPSDAPEDPVVQEAAAYLVGLTQGRVRTSLDFRRPEVDRRLVDFSFNRPAGDQGPTIPRTISDRIAAMDQGDPTARRALARLCVVMGWDDIVRTVVLGATASVEPAKVGRSNGIRIIATGMIEPDYEVDFDVFGARLSELPPEDLDRADVRKALLLEPTVGRRKRRKARS